MKYRKKPVEIEAEIYRPGLEDGWLLVFENRVVKEKPEGYEAKPVIITLEGPHVISPGDYIITGVKGERYPCKPDIFEMTYDRVLVKGQDEAADDLTELTEVCKEAVEYMRKNHCPHDTLIITQSHAEIVSGKKCVQFS